MSAQRSGAADLSFWTHDDGYIKFFSDSLSVADKAGPFTYKLDVTKIGSNDIPTKLIAQAVANTGTPDVVGFEISAFTRMLRGSIASTLLVDLTNSVAEYKDDLIKARLAPFSQNGHLYALDSDTPLAVYYYREDEFSRLGIPSDVPTWEEFAKVGAALHKSKGVSLGALAVGDQIQTVQTFHLLLLQRGGDIFDADGNLTIETPEAEEALKFAASGVQSGFYATVTDMYGPSMQTGLKGSTILGVDMPSFFAGYGIKPNVPEQKGKWRVTTLPTFAGGGLRTAVAGGTGFSVLRDKPLTQAGQDLVVSAYLDPAQQVKRYKDLGYLPTLRSVFDDPSLSAIADPYFGGQHIFDVYKQVVDDAPAVHQSANNSILATVLSGYLLRAYKGGLTASQALSAATDDFRGQTRA